MARFMVDLNKLSHLSVLIDTENKHWLLALGEPDGRKLAKRVCDMLNNAPLSVQLAEQHPHGKHMGLHQLAVEFIKQIKEE